MFNGNHPEILHGLKKSERDLDKRIDRLAKRLNREKETLRDWPRFLLKGENA